MDQSLKAVCDALKKILAQQKIEHQAFSFNLLIGRPHQGKSALLRQSHFEHYPIKAEGAMIYYNQQGIILELSDSFIEEPQRSLPYSLKQLNRCHRAIKISGILLCIDLHELLTASPSDLPALLKTQSRFIEKFGIDLGYPIDMAIVLTKLDLIAGFSDFFQNEHESDLKKPWGFSIHEFGLSYKLSDLFKTQFDNLIEALGQQVIHKIHPVRSSIKRTLIREFPLQLANSRHILLPLITAISPKLFRLQAMYFTSAEQGGISVDKLTNKIRSEYALTLQHQLHQSANHRAYFIEGALHSFQRQTKREAPTVSFSHRGATFALIGSTLLGLALLSHHYIKSSRLLDKASQELIAFDSLEKSNTSTYSATYHLTRAAKALNTISTNSLFMPTIESLKAKLKQNSAQYLSKRFLPNLMRDIEQALADDKLSPVERYHVLKIYLMLDDPTHFSEKEILAWFKQHWEKQQDTFNLSQKMTLLTGLLHQRVKQFPINKQAVVDARNFLNALPTSYLYYSLAKTAFSNDTLPIQLNGFVLSTDKIPVYLTKPGFQKVIKQIPVIVDNLKAENWILARQDLNDLALLIQQAYCFEYVIWWQHFMSGTHPTHIQDYDQATQLLKTLQHANTISALVKLLQEHTSPTMGDDSSLFNQEIASKFSEFNLMSHSSLRHLVSSLTELEKFLSTLSIVNDHGKTAFNLTKARFQGDAIANPLSALYSQSQQLPAPLSLWTKQIADDIWFSLINSSRAYLNWAWQQEVFHDYQMNIANRYPFDTSKTDEISIHDFNQFFSPRGTLNHFIETYLSSFLDRSKPQWQLKEVNNYVLPISSDMVNELIRANVITNMFFPDRSDTCQVEFSLQKINLDPIVASLQLTIGDTKLKDTQGSDSFTEFHWPESNARLVVHSIEGQQYEIEELGSWAFFKILQKVNVLVDEQDSSNLQILFEINGNSGRYLLKAQNPVNPFIPGILNEFNLLDTIV